MEDGRYAIHLALTTVLPGPDDSEARALADRLEVFLPINGKVSEVHTDPSTNGVDLVAWIDAKSPVDALQQLRAAVEHLEINVRSERHVDPIGPMSRLRYAGITHDGDTYGLPPSLAEHQKRQF
jgi:hypothetical protein